MPINIPGILVPLHLLVNPRIVLPSLIVKDIRQLDFPELRKAGYRGAVFDKDNCLTLPHQDRLVPELTEAWRECRETFGKGNVLLVSNSAGSHLDAGEIQAESVTHHLSVPVLRHPSPKPSYSCIASIRAYFTSLPAPIRDDELVVVGDRILTDVVIANRMARRQSPSQLPRRTGPLAVWTECVWQPDSTAMRWLEKGILRGVERWIVHGRSYEDDDYRRFVRSLPAVEQTAKEGLLKKMWSRFFST
ncbi:hypothetical protein AcV7_006153 [Taiwanofungus camphoratus]|nr:hypothetical protein AcV7_006153 [Antrodia cinnamomea]